MKKFYLLVYYLILAKLPSSFFPLGKWFNRLRVGTLKKVIVLGQRNVIQSGFRFGAKNTVEIGNDCEINENVYIQSAQIGNHVLIAQNVSLLAITHNFEERDTPILEQGFTLPRPVIVENNVWIGRNAIIMPGVVLGTNCIIGAGAVVTKNIPPYAVAGGVPARIIKFRT